MDKEGEFNEEALLNFLRFQIGRRKLGGVVDAQGLDRVSRAPSKPGTTSYRIVNGMMLRFGWSGDGILESSLIRYS